MNDATGPRRPEGSERPELPAEHAARGPRPLIERVGMAFIAAGIAAVFMLLAVFSLGGGDAILAAMALAGALMTAWAGARTLLRG